MHRGRIIRGAQRYYYALLFAGWAIVLMGAVVLIPGVLVDPIRSRDASLQAIELPPIITDTPAEASDEPLMIPIYLSQEKRVISVSLEQYVRGVLAAEMPIDFELEALKAQAIAARTYIVKRVIDQDFSNVPVREAWVTDTVQHQAYLTNEAILSKWGRGSSAAEVNIAKLTEAVEQTRGQIITYGNQPILAAFFSTSNGYTENSEEYWIEELPYLRSVSSPWEEKLSPKFETTVAFPAREFINKLNLPTGTTKLTYKILEKSAGQRIKKIRIAGVTFTGREVRDLLGLASTQFELETDGKQIIVTSKGNGHGVGMSQWGAQGMALAGSTAEEIIRHYYSGTEIRKI